MNRRHLVGLILWRGGLLLAGGWGAYRIARVALQSFDLPLAVEVGGSLVVAGVILVVVSVLFENADDRRLAGAGDPKDRRA